MESLEEWLNQGGGLAASLRDLRRLAGLTGHQLGSEHGWAQSKVSRLESGKQMPTEADVDAWARTTMAGEGERQRLQRLRQEAEVAHFSFRQRMRDGQAVVQASYTRLVEQSTLIRHVDAVWVPGLLQVPEYARRIFQEMIRLGHTRIDDVDAAVTERMRRQEYLYDPSKQFEFLLAEPVLRWLFCPVPVMRAQLDRLLSATHLDRVRVGIIPLGVELAWSPVDTYQVYAGEETVVMVETLVGDSPHRGDQAKRYVEFADHLWSQALTGDEARRVILAAQAALPA